MKKDLFTKVLIFITTNVFFYLAWFSFSYFNSSQSFSKYDILLNNYSTDLYKLSQILESLTKNGEIDCVKVFENDSNFFNSTSKFNCTNLLFFNGFFHSKTIERKVDVQFRLKNSELARSLLIYPGFVLNFSILFLFLYLKRLRLLQSQKIKEIEMEVEASQKLAHDIRSPLSTLNLISGQIADPSIKDLQASVVSQINQIASKILNLNENIQIANETSPKAKATLSNLSFFQLLKQMGEEFKLRSNVISLYIDESVREIAIHPPAFLYATINNLVQNSFEATIDKISARIQLVALVKNEATLEIKISDNGKGIPAHILKLLGNTKISSGKDRSYSGNGIGVYNAAVDLKAAGGSITFDSIENQGTTVTITLPVTLF